MQRFCYVNSDSLWYGRCLMEPTELLLPSLMLDGADGIFVLGGALGDRVVVVGARCSQRGSASDGDGCVKSPFVDYSVSMKIQTS